MRCFTSHNPYPGAYAHGPSSLIAIGNAHVGHVLLRQHKKIRIIRYDDPPLLQGIGQVHVIRRATETSLYCRRDVDTTAPQAFGNGVGDMLVKVKAHCPRQVAHRGPGFWRDNAV